MPTLLAAHALIGFGLSAVFVGALLFFDIAGIGRLLETDVSWPFAFVLWFFIGLTFASALMGSAVMSLAANDVATSGRGRHKRADALRVAEVPISTRH